MPGSLRPERAPAPQVLPLQRGWQLGVGSQAWGWKPVSASYPPSNCCRIRSVLQRTPITFIHRGRQGHMAQRGLGRAGRTGGEAETQQLGAGRQVVTQRAGSASRLSPAPARRRPLGRGGRLPAAGAWPGRPLCLRLLLLHFRAAKGSGWRHPGPCQQAGAVPLALVCPAGRHRLLLGTGPL